MSLSTSSPLSRAALTAALTFSLAGCGQAAEPSAEADAAVNAAAPVPEAAATPAAAASQAPASLPASVTLEGVADDALPGTEAPEDTILGRWEVVDVAPDAAAPAGAAPDRSIVGRRFAYTSEMLGWLGASGQVETAGQCPLPTFAIVQTAAVARDLGKAFGPAWAKFGLDGASVGAPHEWNCDTEEEIYFGPDGGAIFYPVAGGRMVMNWSGNRILLLRRVPG